MVDISPCLNFYPKIKMKNSGDGICVFSVSQNHNMATHDFLRVSELSIP
jgi:hypothetical protein